MIALLGDRQPLRLDLPLPAREGARVAGARGRRRPPAHRRAHLGRRPASAWCWSQITGEAAFDSIAALAVAVAIVVAGLRHPVALGPGAGRRGAAAGRARPDRGARSRPSASTRPEIAGYHKLRARRAGARRYIDLHLQFRAGTTLEHAHEVAHQVREAIEARVPALRGPDPHRARAVAAPARGRGAGALPAPVAAVEQVDRGRRADRRDHDRVAAVAADREQDRGDRADRRRRSATRLAAGDTPLLSPTCQTDPRDGAPERRRRRGRGRPFAGDVGRPARLRDPRSRRRAARRQRRSSTPGRRRRGRCSPPPTRPPASRSPTPTSAPRTARSFAVRHQGFALVAAAERFALAGLMVFDIRAALRDLVRGPTCAGRGRGADAPEATPRAARPRLRLRRRGLRLPAPPPAHPAAVRARARAGRAQSSPARPRPRRAASSSSPPRA